MFFSIAPWLGAGEVMNACQRVERNVDLAVELRARNGVVEGVADGHDDSAGLVLAGPENGVRLLSLCFEIHASPDREADVYWTRLPTGIPFGA